MGADEAIVVATPDDACLRDAERVSALLFEKLQLHSSLLLNRVSRLMIWEGAVKKPGDIARALDMPLLGVIPDDEEVYRALLRHRTAVECGGRSVRRAIRRTADRLMGMEVHLPRYCR